MNKIKLLILILCMIFYKFIYTGVFFCKQFNLDKGMDYDSCEDVVLHVINYF